MTPTHYLVRAYGALAVIDTDHFDYATAAIHARRLSALPHYDSVVIERAYAGTARTEWLATYAGGERNR